jgi:uncharacterized protein YbjT (DUF2867 family)
MPDIGVIIIGGTGQVGGAVVRAFAAAHGVGAIVLLARRPVEAPPGVRVVVVDTTAADLEARVTAALTAAAEAAPGLRWVAASCVGVGAGSARWSEDELLRLEVGVVGAFARGCRAGGVRRFGLLTAAGADPGSRLRYLRVMGKKEAAVAAAGFDALLVFRPGVIGENAHTPGLAALLGRLVPGRYGTIAQADIAQAFVRGLCAEGGPALQLLHNPDMRRP